jgi:polyhydroxyalkanoate synthesis regulator phasin
MDPKELTKQMIDFNKTAFDNTFNALNIVQEQTEKVANMLVEQTPLFPQEGKKAVNDWVKTYKKGMDDFKASVDEGYKKMYSFLDKPGK